MKKIYAIAASLLFVGAAFSQRDLNVKLALTTPVEASTVPQTATQSIVFDVTNIGDTLTDGDTLAFYYYNFTTGISYSLVGQTQGSVNIVPLTGQIASLIPVLNGGQALSSGMLQQGGLVANTTLDGFNVGDTIFVSVEVWGKNGEEESDLNFTDNFGSFIIGSPEVSVNRVNAVKMVAYPNPANTVMKIRSSEEISNVVVMTLDGRTVATTNGNIVNVAELPTGIYMYQATTVNGSVYTSKFIKE